MMPRPSSDNMEGGYGQPLGRNLAPAPSFSTHDPFSGNDQFEHRRFTLPTSGQVPFSPGGGLQPHQAFMGNQSMGFRQEMATTSPATLNMNSMQPGNLSLTDMSSPGMPGMPRMPLGFPMSGGSPSTPNFPAPLGDMDMRNIQHSGPSSAMSQAEREEELLLNLLIARRQRGRMEGSKGNQNLADELLRLRQGRSSSSAHMGQSLQHPGTQVPALPGVPPLYADTSGPGSMNPVSYPYPNNTGLLNPMDYRKSDAMSIAAGMQDINERIDRGPNRMIDARTHDMRELPSHGLKRGLGAYEAAAFKYQAAMDLQGLDAAPAKKKRIHKKKPVDMPRRPLSAYNLFFSEERERILKEIRAKEGIMEEEPEIEEMEPPEETGSKDDDDPGKPKALLRPLIPSQKKRRPHRKTHGKISFQNLARMVGERWKSLPEERRKYYQDLAQEDMLRQKAAMEEYYAKQNSSKKDSTDGDPSPESPGKMDM